MHTKYNIKPNFLYSIASSKKKYSRDFLQSPILSLTEHLELNRNFTVQDKVLTIRILMGCAKMISVLGDNHLKKMAKSKRLFSDYNTGLVYLLAIFLITSKGSFTESEIRAKLLSSLKGIQLSDVNEYLNSMVKLGIKTKRKTESASLKRGKPIDTGINGEKKAGRPKILFEDSDYITYLQSVLSKPAVRNLIYCYLIESMLFQKWIYSMLLLCYYRLNLYGRQDFSKITKMAAGNSLDKGAQILYEQCHGLEDDKLREKAWKFSTEIVATYTDKVDIMRDFFSYTCILGAILYPLSIIL